MRKERYGLSVGAIREMIISAQHHLNFMSPSYIQVALFDDRLKTTLPGMLHDGLTLKETVNGRSKIRSRAIVGVFSRMGLIEEWGTGIRHIIRRVEEYQLRTPEFTEIGNTFYVNLFHKEEKKPIKADRKPLSEERRQLIKEYIREHDCISNREARKLLNLAESTTKRLLKQMVLDDCLIEQGEKRSRIRRLHA